MRLSELENSFFDLLNFGAGAAQGPHSALARPADFWLDPAAQPEGLHGHGEAARAQPEGDRPDEPRSRLHRNESGTGSRPARPPPDPDNFSQILDPRKPVP